MCGYSVICPRYLLCFRLAWSSCEFNACLGICTLVCPRYLLDLPGSQSCRNLWSARHLQWKPSRPLKIKNVHLQKEGVARKNLRMDIGDTALRVSRCRHHRNLFLAKSDKMISKQKSFIFLFSNLTVSPSETKMSAFAPLALEITDFVFGKSRFKRPSYHKKVRRRRH